MIIQHLSTKSNPDAERLEPFHSDNAPWHVTATSLSPRLSIKPDPCDIEARPAYSASLNRELISSKHDPTLLLVYSDGSRWKPAGGGEKSGYGVVIYHCAVPIASFSIGLGHRSTVFDAEMFALAHASSKVKKILDAHTIISHVKFYSDSTSSLKVIFEPYAHPAQQCSLLFRSNIIDLLNRMPGLEIDVKWSPGHTDIIGNEAADKAAKAGVRLPSLVFQTHSYAGMSSKMRAQTRWREEWSEEKARRLISNTHPGSNSQTSTLRRFLQTSTSDPPHGNYLDGSPRHSQATGTPATTTDVSSPRRRPGADAQTRIYNIFSKPATTSYTSAIAMHTTGHSSRTDPHPSCSALGAVS